VVRQDDPVRVKLTWNAMRSEPGCRGLTQWALPGTYQVRATPLYVDGVRNHVEVGGPSVADDEVRENLSTKLRYDRAGYGIVFNNLGVDVENGVVTIAGNVRDYPDRDSALAIVSTTAGVKEVVDEVEVAPVSISDDRLRVRLARAIYGDMSLKRYAMDPQAPIRIIVKNGHVELAGLVLNDLDRQLAFTKANLVPGIFSVTNNLSVASELKE